MQEHLAYPNARRQVACIFHLIKPNDVDISVMWGCKNVIGICFLHLVALVSPRDVTLLKLKDLACFCPKCMDDNHVRIECACVAMEVAYFGAYKPHTS
jgi:hypothetical protein